MSSGDDLLLPPEIWYRILTKLPVKSILRFRCVSKTWYSQLSCPNFVSDHATETLNYSSRNRVLVHHLSFRTARCSFSFHDESFLESHELDLPEPLRDPDIRIVGGSCNGLICLTDGCGYSFQSILIWNPSIGKWVQLPYRCCSAEVNYVLGFGFDSNSRDYKVLRVGYRKSGDFVPVSSEIFNMRKGVWRRSRLPMTPSPFRLPCDHSCVYLNGTLHWIGNDSRSNCSLVCFNLSSEVFLEMGMPLGLELLREDDDFLGFIKVLPINGLLSVAVSMWQLQGDAHCLVWSMKEYGVTESWTKLFHIEPPSLLTGSNLFGFRENGEVFIWDEKGTNNKNDVLVSYDPESGTSKPILSTKQLILNVCFYTESLVLL